jgi:hypothetical protein
MDITIIVTVTITITIVKVFTLPSVVWQVDHISARKDTVKDFIKALPDAEPRYCVYDHVCVCVCVCVCTYFIEALPDAEPRYCVYDHVCTQFLCV